MTATLHKLGAGGAAALYYTNDSARESQPSHRDEYYSRDGGGVWWSSGESVVRHGAAIDAEASAIYAPGSIREAASRSFAARARGIGRALT